MVSQVHHRSGAVDMNKQNRLMGEQKDNMHPVGFS